MFDLILLDYTLPGKSSIRLLEWLKQYQLTTPVISRHKYGSFMIEAASLALLAKDGLR
jgi:DNA-binding response OmpR family regulator